MTTPGIDGIRHTDTIKTRASSARPAEQTNWIGITKLIGDHVDDLAKVIGDHVADLETNLERRLKALELQLAETRGAVDVLRGKGLPGTFNPKGTCDARAVYNRLDVVVRDSSSFVALRDKPGACPGDDWQMIACGGKRGVAGERGPAGPPGPAPTFAGARFNRNGMELETSAGAIPIISSVSVDSKDFSLKISAADGSTLKINLLPLFTAYHEQTTAR